MMYQLKMSNHKNNKKMYETDFIACIIILLTKDRFQINIKKLVKQNQRFNHI